jgi:hypothetical protein
MTIAETLEAAKTIPNHEGYSITEDGRVWSKPRKDTLGRRCGNKWLKSVLKKHGYLMVSLTKYELSYIHRLVLETFIGPCPDKMECRHLDGDPLNNNLENLKWGTPSENRMDTVRHHRHPDTKGERHGGHKLSEQDVRMIVYIYQTGLFEQKEIAKMYSVTPSAISLITRKRTWRHIWA